jgi:Zn-dependent membrane protease YugP
MWLESTWPLFIPPFLLAIYAQWKVKSAFNRYSRVRSMSGMTGAQVAQALLHGAAAEVGRAGGRSQEATGQLAAVQVRAVTGQLSDHYDPRHRILNLSEPVYASNSLAALGVAAHETGHAFQHATGYGPLALRSVFVPAAQFGSWLAWPLFIVGLILAGNAHASSQTGGGSWGGLLMNAGILLYVGAVIFTLITLPVEFDASRRAIRMLREGGLVQAEEVPGVRAVLSAAALTYVAAAAMAIITLLRMLLIRGRD